MPSPRLALLAAVAAHAALVCAPRAVSGGFIDVKTDALRKAVQALPAAKVAAALDAASEALDVKALVTNGTAHTTLADGGGAASADNTALPHPLIELLAHVAGAEEWKAEELHALAEVFAGAASDGAPTPDVPVSPASPADTELVAQTDPSTSDSAKAAPSVTSFKVRPPLPANPAGTKVVWDAATQHWKLVPLTPADKWARAAAKAAAKAKAAGGAEATKEAEGEGEEDDRPPRSPRKAGGGPLSPDALSPSQAARVAALVKDKGLTEEASLTAVAATPGASVKVAYVWYLLNTDAADQPLDSNPLVVAPVPPEVVVEQTPTDDLSRDVAAAHVRGGGRRRADGPGRTSGRRLLQTTNPTVWAANNVNQASGGRYTPPDGAIAVGAGYIVQASNSFYTVRNATSGALLVSPVSLTTLMGTTSVSFGDPRLLFDAVANRFFLACYGVAGRASWTYIATTKTSNPRSGWYVYRFTNAVTSWAGCEASNPCFGDYPTLGQDRYSIWVTTNQFAQYSSSDWSYVGIGVWALGKTALKSGTATVPTRKWFIDGSQGAFTLQPAKNSEAGKMHLMAAYGDTDLMYMYATGTARLNAQPPASPTLSGVKWVTSSLAMPFPPDPITQGNSDELWGSDGRMQMCTQAGNNPAANALLYCTLDIGCQMSNQRTTCLYIAAFTPSSTTVTMKSRIAIGASGRHTMLGALAANPSSKVAGVVATGVYRSSSSSLKVASLFYRYNATSGRVTSTYVAANTGWLYDSVDPGRIGDYNDANLDSANRFYGQAEYGYPTTSWASSNWATNIFKAGIA